ncbi:MAG TPA: electron transfer flavoprotein subunit alpha, partial [Methylophilaceae bacterium]|nr:electron transfer flavoprotein subunit alpha [Methylophilaceae bacterium]
MSEAEAKKPAGKKKFELDDRLKAYKGIWVFIEHERGVLHPVSLELLGEARKLADKLGVEVAGVVMGVGGEKTRSFCNEAFHYGADLCYLMEDPLLTDYRNEPFTKGMTDLVNKYQPEILLLGATTLGRDLAGSVATTLQTGLTADCTELNVDLEVRSLLATRPTFGGSLLCTIQTLNYRPQMATVRPRVMPMPDIDKSRTGRIVEEKLGMVESAIITKVLEFIPDEMQDKPQLPFADIIVSGGRGMKKPENFKLIWDLATVLGAEVGATRPVVQAGWVELDRQVGQSGKTVRPKLY